MRNNRKEERKTLITFTPVYELGKTLILGYLADLTLQGGMLVGGQPLEVDRKLTLVIEFRETHETPATRMTVPARVAWCKHELNSAYYNTGVEFLELTNQNQRVIAAILERYQFRREMPA